MGRPKKYNTEEERLAADRADKRRWYQKNYGLFFSKKDFLISLKWADPKSTTQKRKD